MNIILLAIFPVITAAQIRINIIPETKYSETLIILKGSERAQATDDDVKTFHLTKNEIKSNLDKLKYTRVDNIHVNNANSNESRALYINLKPVKSRILSSYEQPVVTFMKKNINNNGCCLTADMNHVVVETLQSKWYETPDLSVGRNIEVNFSSNRLSCTSTWGKDDHGNKTIQILPITEISVPLKADQKATAVVNVVETSLEVRIDYEATIDGDMYFEYMCFTMIKQICLHKKVLNVNEYFHLLDHQGVVKAYQILTMKFYSEARLQITNDRDGEIVLNKKVQMREF